MIDLTLSNGADLHTNGHRLWVRHANKGTETTTLTGAGTKLFVEENPAVNPIADPSFQTRYLVVDDFARVEMKGGVLQLGNNSTNLSEIGASSALQGFGIVRHCHLVNNGVLGSGHDYWNPSTEPYSLIIDSIITDLDGTSETGWLSVGAGSVLEVKRQLIDAFSGTLSLYTESNPSVPVGNSLLDMTEAWTVDGRITLNEGYGFPSRHTATIRGGDLSLVSGSEVRIDAGTLNIESTLDLFNGDIEIAPQATLRLSGLSRVHSAAMFSSGGQVVNANGATIGLVDGAMIDVSGTFTNNGSTAGSGDVVADEIINNGVLHSDGTLRIHALSGQVDLDGVGDAPVYENGVVKPDRGNIVIVDPLTDIFDGFLWLRPDNAVEFQEAWRMSDIGDVYFHEGGDVAGAEAWLEGTVDVEGHGSFSAPTIFDSSARVTFFDASTVLRLSGNSTIQSGATFSGDGQLVNANGATMTLADGAHLAVSVINEGTIDVGTSAGLATVHNFDQTNMGTTVFEIGGLEAGAEHDKLIVADAISADGTLAVDLVNSYEPMVGDRFDLFDFGTNNGSFMYDFSQATLPAGMSWITSDILATGELVVGGQGMAGDLDNDGQVSGDDLNLVLFNWGDDTSILTSSWLNQRSMSTIVGADHMNQVLFHWGNQDVSASLVAVPEPSSLLLLVPALLLRGRWR